MSTGLKNLKDREALGGFYILDSNGSSWPLRKLQDGVVSTVDYPCPAADGAGRLLCVYKKKRGEFSEIAARFLSASPDAK